MPRNNSKQSGEIHVVNIQVERKEGLDNNHLMASFPGQPG